MSLINDALKKAQRERSHPAASPAPGAPLVTPPPAGSAVHHPPPRARSPWPAVLIVLAVLGGGAAVWFLKPNAPAVAAATPAQPASQPVPAGAAPAPLPTAQAALPVPAPSSGPIAAPVATNDPVQIQINLPGASGPLPAPATTSTGPSTPPPPAAPAVATAPAGTPAASPAVDPIRISLQLEDPRVLAFLDAARINGVRSVADDAKLLMNNKVFKAGSVVDRELGLKLVQILPAELVFEDARGIQYRKLL